MESFKYIVQEQKPQKVCFGSGRAREILGQTGLTYYMRYHTLENYPNIAPWTYNPLKSFKYIYTKPSLKSISIKGYSGIARHGTPIKSKDEYPAPWTYTPEICKKSDQSKYPFGSNVKRSVLKINKNPGPGTYNQWEKKGFTFQHAFGGRAKLNLAVEIKCCETNTDICSVCNEQPIGDYWHKKNKEFLCNACMQRRRSILKKGKGQYLNQFKRIRDCSSIHHHDGTDAKIYLIEPHVIAKCLQKEAYLSVYLDE